MADDVVDVAALVAPIGEGSGEDLRQDYSPSSVYQKLRDARAEARAEERARDSQGEADGTVAEGWRQVRRLAIEALTKGSKDFEIAAWLTEALARQDGLAGLASGARVLTGLLEEHWDNGHPQPDEEGLEGRAAPLGGLAGGDSDGTVMQVLRRTSLFRRPSGEPLSLYQYEASSETSAIADETRREARFAAGVVPLETVETEVRFDLASLRAVGALAAETRLVWRALQDQLDVRFGMDSPPSRRVAEVLDRLVEVSRVLGGAPLDDGGAEAPQEAAEAVVQAQPGGGEAGGAGGSGVPGFNVAGREQALRTLDQLAAFFQKSEPHSFLAYTLADAARRGRMTLPELLAEVLQDESARTGMLTALGIRPTAMDATNSYEN